MKLVIEGVLDQTLPWSLVGIGVAIALAAWALRLPVLAFAVGVYPSVAAMVPISLGGLLRWWMVRGSFEPGAGVIVFGALILWFAWSCRAAARAPGAAMPPAS